MSESESESELVDLGLNLQKTWRFSTLVSNRCPSRWKVFTYWRTCYAQGTGWQRSIWKNAYFAIPVSRHDRKFLRFRWQGKTYQFNCLPFGLHVVGPVDLYQGHKAGSDHSKNCGHENYHLHRRHSGDGSKQGTGSGADIVPDISVGEPGVYNQSAEVSDRPHTGNRLPGSRCRFHSDGTQTTGLKDQEHPVRRQSTASESAHGAGSVKTAGQVDPCNPCNEGNPCPSSGTSKHICKLPCSLFKITSNLALWQKRRRKTSTAWQLTQLHGMGSLSFEAIVAGAYVGFQVKSRRMFALCENHEFVKP